MRRRQRKSHRVEAGINVTSLLDICFVLLISFMVVAPAVRYSIDMELPKVKESKFSDSKKPVSIQVSNRNASSTTYYVDGQATDLDDIANQVASAKNYEGSKIVALEADRQVPWEDVAKLMNELRSKGIDNIGIVTEKGK
ncbi:biopolymer transporter ExbD [Candidatus Sumerlaeota bacterium]|nr:biopolymer transporter ExbD [Candidatus Sumerlaeota bacterium]